MSEIAARLVFDLRWKKSDYVLDGPLLDGSVGDDKTKIVLADEAYDLEGLSSVEQSIGTVFLHKGRWVAEFTLDDDGVPDEIMDKYPNGFDTVEEAKECLMTCIEMWIKGQVEVFEDSISLLPGA